MIFGFIILMILELTIRADEEYVENNEELMYRGLFRMIQLKIITLMTKELLLIALNEIHIIG